MSSRSDMEIVPLGLLAVTRLFRTSGGHSQYHTNGASGRKPGNHTPPTPQLDASQRPWYEAAVRGVSSRMCVGLLLVSLSKLVQVVQYFLTMVFTVMLLKLALLAIDRILSICPSRVCLLVWRWRQRLVRPAVFPVC